MELNAAKADEYSTAKLKQLHQHLCQQGGLTEEAATAVLAKGWRCTPHATTGRAIFTSPTGTSFCSIPRVAAHLLGNPMDRWLASLSALPPGPHRDACLQYNEDGYAILRSVFSLKAVYGLLQGLPDCDFPSAASTSKRPRTCRSATQKWRGAQAIIQQHRYASGLGVLAERSKGRFDLPLPGFLLPTVLDWLADSARVMELLRVLCPRGEIMTANVMLAAPGAERQPKHMDNGDIRGGGGSSPLPPHYVTVLIPLTQQDKLTGLTEVWPKSHRPSSSSSSSATPTKSVCPALNVGDALVFDGLLLHLGTANKTVDRDRYFFYLAFSTNKTDRNTELTGQWYSI